MLKLGLVLIAICLVSINCQDVSEYSADILPSFLALVSDILPDYLNSTVLMSLAVNSMLTASDLVFDNFLPPPELPVVDEEFWWGEDLDEEDTSIREFSIQFNETRLTRLIEKLNDRENFTKPLNGSRFNYGVNTDDLNVIINRYLTKYDFEARQDRLNQFPQYKTQIQGLDIHFIHITPNSTEKTVVPLLVLHGAPLTNMEFIYLLPYLMQESEDYDFVFEIIVPSIPGFGYSQRTNKIGLNTYQTAIIFKNLMQRLGFDQYYVHSGDFGQFIAGDMATLFPDNVLGIHSNFAFSLMPKTLTKYAIGSLYPPAVSEEQYISRLYPLSSVFYRLILRAGYFHEQGTKPDTKGTAMSDSPAGLLGWLVETFSPVNTTYDDNNGTINRVNVEDILDHATIIWDAQSVTTWMRYYAEFSAWFQDPNQWAILRIPTTVPFAAFKALSELIYEPDEWIMDKFPNLVYSRTVNVGSHYFAYQYPDILASSIWNATSTLIEFNANK